MLKNLLKKYGVWVLLLMVLVCYLNSLPNPFISDDIAAIAKNPLLKTVTGAFDAKTPLRDIIYFLIANTVGIQAWAFRLLNIVSHVGAVLFAYLLFTRLTNRVVGFMTAALLAVHPLMVEAVGWISGGPYSTAGMCMLAALYFQVESDRRRSVKMFLFSVVSFIAALATSEKALIYGGLVALYYLCFAIKHWDWRKMGVLAGITLLDFLIQISNLGTRYNLLGKNGVDLHNPVAIIPVSIVSYLKLLFWPSSLSLYHADLVSQTEVWTSFALVGVYILLLVYCFFRARKIFFGLAWFIVVLLPVLAPLGIASTVAERYIYFASLGIFFIVSYGFWWVYQKTEDRRLIILFCVMVVLLMIRTITRNTDFAVPERFWLATIQASPRAYQAYHNLGMVYESQKKYDAAIRNYQKTLSLKPDYAEVYYKLGYVFQITNNLRQAEIEYLTAIKLDPEIWQAYQNLGGLYLQVHDYDRAIANARRAVALYPSAEMYANLGIIYVEQTDYGSAKEQLQKALVLDPQNEKAKYWLTQIPKY